MYVNHEKIVFIVTKVKACLDFLCVLQVNPTSPAVAKYIEMHISANDMRAFIFENTEDYNLFMREVRDRQNLKVNALKVPNKPLSAFKARKEISYYRSAISCLYKLSNSAFSFLWPVSTGKFQGEIIMK